MKLAVAHRDRLVREALRRTFVRTGHELLWSVDDAEQMLRSCRRDAPALLLAELELLGPQGEAVPRLASTGASVVGLVSTPGAGAGYEVLGRGALGLLEPPHLDDSGELVGAERALAVVQRLGILVEGSRQPTAPATNRHGQPGRFLALGASTGGPLALARVLAALPADLDAAVLVVQHIEREFVEGLAEWLGSQCALPVGLAQRGEAPVAGHVYLAGGGGHLVLLPSLHFGQRPAREGELHVPGVDPLFLSLAAHAAPGAAAILTGMGEDGALGLAELRRRHWMTLAQDEASSVVYGMPRAAVAAGAVQQVLPLAQLGPALARHLQKRRAS